MELKIDSLIESMKKCNADSLEVNYDMKKDGVSYKVRLVIKSQEDESSAKGGKT